MIVNTFFLTSEIHTDEELQALSAEQLEGYTFLYRDASVKSNRKVGNSIVAKYYHSSPVLAKAQRHFWWTTCSPDLRSSFNRC